MTKNHPNENVEIVIVPSQGGACAVLDRRKIKKLLREKLLVTSKEAYRKVQVEVEEWSNKRPRALVVTMMRAYTYTADVVKVTLDAQCNVESIKVPHKGVAP